MARTAPTDQFYMDFGDPTATKTPTTPDREQLPGQTTFDLLDTARVLSLLADGTTATLH